LRLDWTTTGAYTPDTVPPECIRIRVHGEALPDDADVIRCAVALQGEAKQPATTYAELKVHENAGVRQIRNPITDEVTNVVIYHHETVWVRQKGAEEPAVGMLLFMRRGDVA
jgi:hypothetical protein